MNGKDIFLGMQYLDTKFIEKAEFGEFSRKDFYQDLDAGKKRGKLRRAFLLAAVIALLSLLVGCGVVYVMKMQDLKIGDRQGEDYVWNGDVFVPGTWQEVSQQVLTVGSLEGSANYQASKEWYEFKADYAREHKEEPFACPEEYDFYRPYSREMVDKLEEILKKYDLKPMGAQVRAKSGKGMRDYLGIQSFLRPDAPARIGDYGGILYYENGGCVITSYVLMDEGAGRWEYPIYTSCAYSPKDCFDSQVLVLNDPENWQQWHYTTSAGQDLLVLHNPEQYESYAISDQGSMIVSVTIESTQWIYGEEDVQSAVMSQRQIEQLLDTVDLTLKPKPGDPALLSGLPEAHDDRQRIQTREGYTVELKSAETDGNTATAVLRVTAPEGKTLVKEEDGERWADAMFQDIRITSPEKSGVGFGEQPAVTAGGGDNEMEYILTWHVQGDDGKLLPQWTIQAEGLKSEAWTDSGSYIQWYIDGVWRFDFDLTLSEGTRELRFLTEPTEILGIAGMAEDGGDIREKRTVTDFTLYSGSASVTFDTQGKVSYWGLYSWQEARDPMVVLRDGSTIALLADGGSGLDASNAAFRLTMKAEREIPLAEVDHILLVDGTKLYPQEG